MTKQEVGAMGGKVTVARHGREHMRAIGKRGFAGCEVRAHSSITTTLSREPDGRNSCWRLAEQGS
jgi:hypothetical protein